jgi:hypothetical protein
MTRCAICGGPVLFTGLCPELCGDPRTWDEEKHARFEVLLRAMPPPRAAWFRSFVERQLAAVPQN